MPRTNAQSSPELALRTLIQGTSTESTATTNYVVETKTTATRMGR